MPKPYKIVLASGSPRRQQFFKDFDLEDQFDFEILNFTPINCGHAANKPYLLRASSRDERDMWVSAPVVTWLTDQDNSRECFEFCFAL